MKTKLPQSITTQAEAEAFLKELYNNGEIYHPEDDAHGIIWNLPEGQDEPTNEECDLLNDLMDQCTFIKNWDACGYINGLLRAEEVARMKECIREEMAKHAADKDYWLTVPAVDMFNELFEQAAIFVTVDEEFNLKATNAEAYAKLLAQLEAIK